jgi:hypothetical protein
VRNMHGNLYLSMDMATESEVADIEGSTATACSVLGMLHVMAVGECGGVWGCHMAPHHGNLEGRGGV